MIRLLVLVFVFALALTPIVAVFAPLIALSQAACTPAFLNTALTSTDILAAIASAVDGDVICLASGTGSLDAGLGIDKAIELRGAGAFVFPWGSSGSTVILTNNKESGILESTVGNVIVSNITWRATATMTGDFGMWTITRNGATGKPVIFHHNTFEIVGSGIVRSKFLYFGVNRGVVYRNIFSVDTQLPDFITTSNEGYKLSTNFDDWETDSTMGAAGDPDQNKNLYVETNLFIGMGVAVDFHSNARGVHRNNTHRNSSLSDHGFDSSSGERHTQILDNIFECVAVTQTSIGGSIAKRGGTHMIAGNTFGELFEDICLFGQPPGIKGNAYVPEIYVVKQCLEIRGWPGTYPSNYPIPRQIGWGSIAGQNQAVGRRYPGDPSSPVQQALEPTYFWGNATTMDALIAIPFSQGEDPDGYVASCRGMTYGATGKGGAAATQLQVSGYVAADQHVTVIFGDLVGGTTPTISSDINNAAWAGITGKTHGSAGTRVTGWEGRMTASGLMTVTLTFDSSTAARAAQMMVMRDKTATPKDKNPAVIDDDSSPYTGPLSTPLVQPDEQVVGYWVLNGPTVVGASQYEADTITFTSPALEGMTAPASGFRGCIGTTGDTAASNVTVCIGHAFPDATTSMSLSIENLTAHRAGLAGTITFKNAGNNRDLKMTDYFQPNRELFHDDTTRTGEVDCPANPAGTCSKGVGSGTRANRPGSCVAGTAYAPTDFPNVLDKCVAEDDWDDAWYTKPTYPHPLATVTGSTSAPVTFGPGVLVGPGVTAR